MGANRAIEGRVLSVVNVCVGENVSEIRVEEAGLGIGGGKNSGVLFFLT